MVDAYDRLEEIGKGTSNILNDNRQLWFSLQDKKKVGRIGICLEGIGLWQNVRPRETAGGL